MSEPRPITIEQIEAAVLKDRRREAAKHQPGCASLQSADGECRCEVDGVFMWCTHCGAKFSFAEIADKKGCPKCGTRGVPCAAIDDVQVTVNWHELRILVIWAEHWAAQESKREPASYEDPRSRAEMPEVVRAIARRLQEQQPTRTSLSLAGEFAALKQVFPSAQVIGPIQPDDSMLPPKVN